MTRERIFELVMRTDAASLAEIAHDLRGRLSFETAKPPAAGLVMLRALDGVERKSFNAGEILVATAEVTRGTATGWAMVQGNQPSRAFDAATVMAAWEAEDAERPAIEALARRTAARLDAAEAAEARVAAATRVSFEVMGGQDPYVTRSE
jgi:alpha-D-ribose 1-methylphosphonate 5-triphosphate synthase subunit PhnG